MFNGISENYYPITTAIIINSTNENPALPLVAEEPIVSETASTSNSTDIDKLAEEMHKQDLAESNPVAAA